MGTNTKGQTATEAKEALKVMANLAEIKNLATKWLNISEEAETIGGRAEADDVVDECIKTYTKISKTICYNAAVESGDPMKYAVREYFYPTIKVKTNVNKEMGTITRTLEDASKPIDLIDLHKQKEGIGADTKWIYAMQRFNYLLTIRAADRLGTEVKKDCYQMHDIAREIDLGKNPTSDKNLLSTLQKIVNMMLGEGYEATKIDVNYLVDCYVTDNKKSKTQVNAANHKTLCNYLKKVCYRIIEGKGYEVLQKEIKEK